MFELVRFILASIREVMHNVTWPDYEQLQKDTSLVLTSSLVFSLFIGLADFVYRGAFGWFYNIF